MARRGMKVVRNRIQTEAGSRQCASSRRLDVVAASPGLATRSPVHIRRAGPGDVQLLCDLSESYNDVIRRHARGKADAQLLGSERKFFERAVSKRNRDTLVFVADCAGRGVGFVFATVERTADDLVPAPYIGIALLAVADAYRRRGVASKLVREIHRHARARRIASVVLAAHEFNKGALAFYERLGYSTIMRKLRKRLQYGNKVRHAGSPVF